MPSNRLPFRLCLLFSTALLPGAALAQVADAPPAAQAAAAPASDLDLIIVTGTTSKNRTLISSSADQVFASAADIQRKVPKSVAELLELVPGIFVEGTAGGVSNNYSVRGLQGGGQRFVQLQEDGLPILYGGGGGDEFFAYDITIDRLEAVKGGSSGVLTVNGAGATINFLSREPNFKEEEAIAQFRVQSYGEKRGDFYFSTPITDSLAVNIGGYFSTSPGIRNNPFHYDTYHLKGAIEKKFAGGGYVKVTAKIGDQKDAYYADQPYRLGADRQPTGVPGLDTQFGNIGGTSFANISLPVSTNVSPDGLRPFRLSRGIEAKTKQIRLDLVIPVNEHLDLFAHARYLGLTWDFNGLFPGSGTGNGGLTSAVNYLDPTKTLNTGGNPASCGDYSYVSSIGFQLCQAQQQFPGTTQFGIKDLRTGRLIPSTDTASLNGLNGNGLLQRTTLNHDYHSGHDFGSNFGARYENHGSGWANSLTVGIQYFSDKISTNQSATANVINDVRNDSHIYDVVALGATGNTTGLVTDNGVVNYGNWGAGINNSSNDSVSVYFNDELKIGDKLNIDFGVRQEHLEATRNEGQSAAVNQPVPAGTVGVTRDVGSTFNGQYNTRNAKWDPTAYTVGINYRIVPKFALYGRFADGFQTQGVDGPAKIRLYEAGIRFHGHGAVASVTGFRTEFKNQNYTFQDVNDPTKFTNLKADYIANGVEIDLNYRPLQYFGIEFNGVFQEPQLTNVYLAGVIQPFNGNRPERTPATLFTITPTFSLPHGLGEIYGRYKYIGDIFADNGNGLALPAYGVVSLGADINITKRLSFGISADNLTNEIGLTEGNPRQGQTQNATGGYFYARGIVGTTYAGRVTYRF